MTCPGCGAPMQLDEDRDCFNCSFCKSEYQPEPTQDGIRILQEKTAFNCPVCLTMLADGALAGRRLLHCRECGGILLPVRDLVPLLAGLRSERGSFAAAPRSFELSALSREIRCPHCHEQMDTHPYGGPGNIVIDTCENCEVNWLDRGELARVVAAPDHQYS